MTVLQIAIKKETVADTSLLRMRDSHNY